MQDKYAIIKSVILAGHMQRDKVMSDLRMRNYNLILLISMQVKQNKGEYGPNNTDNCYDIDSNYTFINKV